MFGGMDGCAILVDFLAHSRSCGSDAAMGDDADQARGTRPFVEHEGKAEIGKSQNGQTQEIQNASRNPVDDGRRHEASRFRGALRIKMEDQ